MTDDAFDAALIAAAFRLAARQGWSAVSVIAAAREAELPLDRARTHFAGKDAILLGFGRLADAAALADAPSTGPVRERLFDVLMRRFDALQSQRQGVLAVLSALPRDPATAFMLTAATANSMGWMLEAAGYPPGGVLHPIAVQAITAAWAYAVRTWQVDESADLSATMAALDKALTRLEQIAGWFGQREAAVSQPKPFPEPTMEGGIVSGAADVPPLA